MLMIADMQLAEVAPYILTTDNCISVESDMLKALAESKILPSAVLVGDSHGLVYFLGNNTALVVGVYALAKNENRVDLSFSNYLNRENIRSKRTKGMLSFRECADMYLDELVNLAHERIPYVRLIDMEAK